MFSEAMKAEIGSQLRALQRSMVVALYSESPRDREARRWREGRERVYKTVRRRGGPAAALALARYDISVPYPTMRIFGLDEVL